MNCRQVTHLMSAYVDGELTGMEMLEIRRHIRDCSGCGEEFQSIRTVKFMVSRLRTIQPDECFSVALSAKLDEIQVPVYQRMWNSLVSSVHLRPSPVAATFVAVAAALVVLSAKSVDHIDTTGTLTAAQPPMVMSSMEAFHHDILPVRSEPSWDIQRPDPYYASPMPVSSPEGTFLTVSFGH